jgi:hypothetical protein
MKILSTLLFLTIFSVSLQAQQTPPLFDGHKWVAPYHLPTPTNWGVERFLIPISFTPQIQYKGVEDIRFTPVGERPPAKNTGVMHFCGGSRERLK